MKKLTKTQQVKKLRSLLIKSCDAHIKAGGKIVAGSFGSISAGCCPITCATNDALDYYDSLKTKLGFELKPGIVGHFRSGFDDDDEIVSEFTVKTLAYKMGRELRKKYIPEAK